MRGTALAAEMPVVPLVSRRPAAVGRAMQPQFCGSMGRTGPPARRRILLLQPGLIARQGMSFAPGACHLPALLLCSTYLGAGVHLRWWPARWLLA